MRLTFLRRLTLCLAIAANTAPALAQTSHAILDYNDRFHPTASTLGMVVSQEQMASEVGAKILRQGGNAVDAAVATGFALAVTLPQAGNLGGGGFMLIHLAKPQQTLAIDFREMAPAAAHATFFQDAQGTVLKQKARFSRAATGVPGTVAGLVHAQQRYGKLTLKQVMQPAISLAKNGFPVSRSLATSFQRSVKRFQTDPSSVAYFLNQGQPYQQGQTLIQTDLAATLKAIAKSQGKDFYHGHIADLIVQEMQGTQGVITHQDLANYQVIERPVIRGNYHGYEITSMPPPSSGGVHLVQMLNMIEQQPIDTDSHNSAAYIHLLVNAMKYAYADRSEYLGDPDFVEIPIQQLTSKAYAKALVATFTDTALDSSAIKPGAQLPQESHDTTHYNTWDSEGNVVSVTTTLNFSFGNGTSVDGAGFLLNNEMDDFSAKAGVPNAYGLIGNSANAIAPGKRPLSSMTPTIVFKDGKPILATGAPGGSTIITSVLQNVLNILSFDMNVAEATYAPRFHHQWLPDVLRYEDGISQDTLKILQQQGYTLKKSRAIARIQAIHAKDGVLYGASDTRWPDGGVATQEKP